MTRRAAARGGKGGTEPRARIRLREVQVMEHIMEGESQTQIATRLGISQAAVSKIAKRIEERLLVDLAWRVDRQRARHSLRLELIYRESFTAWRASQSDGLRKRQRKTDGASGVGTTMAEVVSENRHGDPRYLDEARKALSDLRTLWGVDAPESLSIAPSPYAGLTDAALDAELARQTRLLQSTPHEVPSTSNTSEELDDATSPETEPRSPAR